MKIVKTLIFSYRSEVLEIFSFIFHFPVLFLCTNHYSNSTLTLLVILMVSGENRTEKQIISSKTTINWLLYDIWCYLFIAFFDWKIVFFQQTVLRVYYILKYISFLGVLNWFAVHSQTKKYMEIIFRPRVGKVKHARVFQFFHQLLKICGIVILTIQTFLKS